MTLHRPEGKPFVATLRGRRVAPTLRNRLRIAPLLVGARIRRQGIALYLRGLPVVPRKKKPHDARHRRHPARSPLRVRVVRQLFRNAVARLPLRVRMPDGEMLGDPDGPLMRVVRAEDFFSRVGADGLIGFGEAYMAGDWEADDLAGVLTVMARELASLVPAPSSGCGASGRGGIPVPRRGPSRTRAATSSGITTCRTIFSPSSSTRR